MKTIVLRKKKTNTNLKEYVAWVAYFSNHIIT